jgi:hypothetical protein
MSLLSILPIGFGIAGALLSFLNTATKIRARHDVSKALRSNIGDLSELEKDLAENNLDAAAALVRKHTLDLSPRERSEVEAALTQTSASGRAAYIRGVSAAGRSDGTGGASGVGRS